MASYLPKAGSHSGLAAVELTPVPPLFACKCEQWQGAWCWALVRGFPPVNLHLHFSSYLPVHIWLTFVHSFFEEVWVVLGCLNPANPR